ncbi:MAG: BrnT family toxin [Candidatus Limnocylindria bacterium]
MLVEFDAAKSAANKTKRRTDFNEAARLWNDPHRVEIPARTIDETRYMVIGTIGRRQWSAIITYRGGKTRIHLGPTVEARGG